MTRRTPLALFALAAALVASSLGGCDAEAGSPEALTVQVYASPWGQDPFQDVDIVAVRVVGDDLTDDLLETTPYEANGSLTLPRIPHDEAAERQIVVEGLAQVGDSSFATVSRGASISTRVDTKASAPASLSILLARINSFLPLTNASGAQQPLTKGRVGHSVSYTPRHEVVIAGGGTPFSDGAGWWTLDGVNNTMKSIEVVDEVDMSARVHPFSLNVDRVFHTGTALPTGQVFFAGGYGTINGTRTPLLSVEVYDPGPTGEVQLLAHSMAKARVGHTATLIDDDTASLTVLFVGGDTDGEFTYELWNPYGFTSGAKTIEGLPARRNHSATLYTIPVGEVDKPFVLVAGGDNDTGTLASLFIYNIETDEIVLHPGALPKGPRTALASVFVPRQQLIYLIGGFPDVDRSSASAAIDVYQSAELDLTKSFRQGVDNFNLNIARGALSAALMDDSAILLAGGQGSSGAALDSIEIIHEYLKPVEQDGETVAAPVIKVSASCTDGSCAIPSMLDPRIGAGAVLLERGLVLLAGGITGVVGAEATSVLGIELYQPQ